MLNANSSVFDITDYYDVKWLSNWEHIAEICGVANNQDLSKICNILRQSKNVLEIGAGSGRVIDYMLEHSLADKITAIEKSHIITSYLQDKYHKTKRVEIIEEDILNPLLSCPNSYHFNTNKYDLILCMWGFITSFSNAELQQLFKNIFYVLDDGGKFILEQPICQKHTDILENIFKLATGETIKVSLFNKDQLNDMLSLFNKSIVKIVEYCGSAANKRIIYIIQ